MKKIFINQIIKITFIFFLFLLQNSLEIVPIWNIENAAINLMSSSSNSYNFDAEDKNLYGMTVKLNRKINWVGNTINH